MKKLLGRLAATSAVLVASVALAGSHLPAGATTARQPLDVRVFAHVGAPGYPEGIAVDTDGTVYVGTHYGAVAGDPGPSKVLAYSPTGDLLRSYTITGQDLSGPHGLLGMALDAHGVLYIADQAPARIIALDTRTGQQRTYALFADVRRCALGAPAGACSDTLSDLPAYVDYPVFAPDGTLYVTDLQQGLIWRVPPGGGRGKVWFTDRALDSPLGPNGIQFLPGGRTMLFAQTGSAPDTAGRLFKVDIADDGSPANFRQFWAGAPLDGADGFAIAASGNVYLALAGPGALVKIGPDGQEIARVPETPLANLQREVPFEQPAGVAFAGKRLLVTNQSFLAQNSDHWAVFDVYAGETGQPLYRPKTTRPS